MPAVPDWVNERITAYLRTKSPRPISPAEILEELTSYGQETHFTGTAQVKKYIVEHRVKLHAQHVKQNGKDYFEYSGPLGGGAAAAAAPGAAAAAPNANNEVGGNVIVFGSNAAAPSGTGVHSRKQSRNRRRRLTRRQRRRS